MARAVSLSQVIIALRTHVCIFVSIAGSEKQHDHRHLETNRKVRKTYWQSKFCVQLDEVTRNHAPQCDLQGLLVNSIPTVHSRDVVPQMLYELYILLNFGRGFRKKVRPWLKPVALNPKMERF